jgi:proteic killer suppression protein
MLPDKTQELPTIMRQLKSPMAYGDDISRLPPARCHELTGNRSGQLSVDLEYPYRLLFIPANEPIPIHPHGGLTGGKSRKLKEWKLPIRIEGGER